MRLWNEIDHFWDAADLFLNEASVVIAGGTENMSQAPKVTSFDYAAQEWHEPKSSMIYDGLTDAFSGKAYGVDSRKGG